MLTLSIIYPLSSFIGSFWAQLTPSRRVNTCFELSSSFHIRVLDEETIFEAVVIEEIYANQPGRVKLIGTSWRAACTSAVCLPVGTLVQVVQRKGLTLVVTPITRNEYR